MCLALFGKQPIEAVLYRDIVRADMLPTSKKRKYSASTSRINSIYK